MKRIIFWLVVVSIVFGLGTATMLLYSNIFNNSGQTEKSADSATRLTDTVSEVIPNADFCELAANPEKYDGKIVRLSAKLLMGLEGAWFSDAKCGADNAAVVSSENKDVWKAIERVREEKDKILKENERQLRNEVNLTVVGKFKNIVYNEGGLTAPFQFQILKVDKASP